MFQSSPALSDGRYVATVPVLSGVTRFNPRPPFRTGATSNLGVLGKVIHVSILARPFGRALLYVRTTKGALLRVSILARPFGRALPRKLRSGCI